MSVKLTKLCQMLLAAAMMATPAAISFVPAHAQSTSVKYFNQKIAFSSDRTGSQNVYVMNTDGSSQIDITPGTDQSLVPSWSPSGNKIVYASYGDSKPLGLFIMNADGSGSTRLNTLPTDHSYFVQPKWSPNGDLIAYVLTDQDDEIASLYTIWPDGSHQTLLKTNALGWSNFGWVSDGRSIVYSGGDFTTNDIYRVSYDGTSTARSTADGTDKEDPLLAPDGTKIVYDTNAGSGYQVFSISGDGSGAASQVTQAPGLNNYSMGWTPDSSRVIFSQSNGTTMNIFSVKPDGTDVTQITNNTGNNNYPSWFAEAVPVTTNDDGTTTSTVSTNHNYTDLDYTVVNQEYLSLDGALGNVIVSAGGTLEGSGSAGTITVNAGGIIAPGHSPGCLSSGNLTLNGTYQAQIGGTTACSGYDQIKVTGTVNLAGSTLTPTLVNGFVPKVGDSFTLIDNDSTDAVTGTFSGLAEGSTFTSHGVTYKVSYIGGTGNDVTLTVLKALSAPNTGLKLITGHPIIVLVATVAAATGLIVISRRFKTVKR